MLKQHQKHVKNFDFHFMRQLRLALQAGNRNTQYMHYDHVRFMEHENVFLIYYRRVVWIERRLYIEFKGQRYEAVTVGLTAPKIKNVEKNNLLIIENKMKMKNVLISNDTVIK